MIGQIKLLLSWLRLHLQVKSFFSM